MISIACKFRHAASSVKQEAHQDHEFLVQAHECPHLFSIFASGFHPIVISFCYEHRSAFFVPLQNPVSAPGRAPIPSRPWPTHSD